MNDRIAVRTLMKQRGLSVEGMAFKSTRSYSTVNNWLGGKDVSEEVFEDFARVLEMSVEELRSLISKTKPKAAVAS